MRGPLASSMTATCIRRSQRRRSRRSSVLVSRFASTPLSRAIAARPPPTRGQRPPPEKRAAATRARAPPRRNNHVERTPASERGHAARYRNTRGRGDHRPCRGRPRRAPDELLAFPFGLEPRAARALVRAGTLPAAKIGRRTYARRSDVLALVDKLAKKPAKAEPTSNYAELVASARGRR